MFENDLEEEIIDDFGEVENSKDERTPVRNEKTMPVHKDKWTLVEAFNCINDGLRKHKLNTGLYVDCAEAFDYLKAELGFNAIQCIALAVLIENGKEMSFRQMGRELGISRLSMMTYYNDLEKLFEARWLVHRGAMESDGAFEGYALAKGVVRAIRANQIFVPESLECADVQEFVDNLCDHIDVNRYSDYLIRADQKHWMIDFVIANKDLPICKEALKLFDTDSIALLMLGVIDYAHYSSMENEGIALNEIDFVYSDEDSRRYRNIKSDLMDGKHELFKFNFIEHKCEDGIADTSTYVLTNFVKEELLSGFKPVKAVSTLQVRMNGMTECKNIEAKTLFYNEKEGTQIERLKNILSKDQLPLVQERLHEKGMRTGVCILMHGAPGTGKTATAFELARQTGRDIIQMNVTDFKDKYVGESEAKLKAIFDKYNLICEKSKVAPILLLNEGDAILSKRTMNVEKSVDQMSNALQNILLQEMENLKGIMIVTTNLTVNLDKAFERRFVFKVQFEKPGKEVKAKIWKSMIEDLNEEDSMKLAETFDIAGGEIENIARKTIMEYALTGKNPDIEMVKEFAKEEKINEVNRPAVVGFNTRRL